MAAYNNKTTGVHVSDSDSDVNVEWPDLFATPTGCRSPAKDVKLGAATAKKQTKKKISEKERIEAKQSLSDLCIANLHAKFEKQTALTEKKTHKKRQRAMSRLLKSSAQNHNLGPSDVEDAATGVVVRSPARSRSPSLSRLNMQQQMKKAVTLDIVPEAVEELGEKLFDKIQASAMSTLRELAEAAALRDLLQGPAKVAKKSKRGVAAGGSVLTSGERQATKRRIQRMIDDLAPAPATAKPAKKDVGCMTKDEDRWAWMEQQQKQQKTQKQKQRQDHVTTAASLDSVGLQKREIVHDTVALKSTQAKKDTVEVKWSLSDLCISQLQAKYEKERKNFAVSESPFTERTLCVECVAEGSGKSRDTLYPTDMRRRLLSPILASGLARLDVEGLMDHRAQHEISKGAKLFHFVDSPTSVNTTRPFEVTYLTQKSAKPRPRLSLRLYAADSKSVKEFVVSVRAARAVLAGRDPLRWKLRIPAKVVTLDKPLMYYVAFVDGQQILAKSALFHYVPGAAAHSSLQASDSRTMLHKQRASRTNSREKLEKVVCAVTPLSYRDVVKSARDDILKKLENPRWQKQVRIADQVSVMQKRVTKSSTDVHTQTDDKIRSVRVGSMLIKYHETATGAVMHSVVTVPDSKKPLPVESQKTAPFDLSLKKTKSSGTQCDTSVFDLDDPLPIFKTKPKQITYGPHLPEHYGGKKPIEVNLTKVIVEPTKCNGRFEHLETKKLDPMNPFETAEWIWHVTHKEKPKTTVLAKSKQTQTSIQPAKPKTNDVGSNTLCNSTVDGSFWKQFNEAMRRTTKAPLTIAVKPHPPSPPKPKSIEVGSNTLYSGKFDGSFWKKFDDAVNPSPKTPLAVAVKPRPQVPVKPKTNEVGSNTTFDGSFWKDFDDAVKPAPKSSLAVAVKPRPHSPFHASFWAPLEKKASTSTEKSNTVVISGFKGKKVEIEPKKTVIVPATFVGPLRENEKRALPLESFLYWKGQKKTAVFSPAKLQELVGAEAWHPPLVYPLKKVSTNEPAATSYNIPSSGAKKITAVNEVSKPTAERKYIFENGKLRLAKRPIVQVTDSSTTKSGTMSASTQTEDNHIKIKKSASTQTGSSFELYANANKYLLKEYTTEVDAYKKVVWSLRKDNARLVNEKHELNVKLDEATQLSWFGRLIETVASLIPSADAVMTEAKDLVATLSDKLGDEEMRSQLFRDELIRVLTARTVAAKRILN